MQSFENESTSAQTWKSVKDLLNWKSTGSPSRLFHKGLLRTKSQDIANAQNEFFISKIENIKKGLQSSSQDPLSLLQSLMKKNCGSFELKPVHPDIVNQVLGNLSNSKSFGFDNIDTFCIKLAKSELTPAITHIVNLSIVSWVLSNDGVPIFS